MSKRKRIKVLEAQMHEDRTKCGEIAQSLGDRVSQLKGLLERVKTHPAGSWMSAALSEEDTATCVECKRDFQAWFDFLEEISAVLCE